MPDRYVTFRSPVTPSVVQVIDLAPTDQCDSARLMCTTLDSTSAATVAMALNAAHAHDIDDLLDTITTLDQTLLALHDFDHPPASEQVDEVLEGCRARQKERT